jgi:hypothetical protein
VRASIASMASMLVALALLGGCKERSAAPAPAASVAALDPDPVASARRPTRRYYLARTAGGCEIYYLDTGGASPPRSTPCPLELQVGERIRVAGKTCVRESNDPERVEPTVCPDPLTNFEYEDRGEKRR